MILLQVSRQSVEQMVVIYCEISRAIERGVERSGPARSLVG